MMKLSIRVLVFAAVFSLCARNAAADIYTVLQIPHVAVGGGYVSYLTINGSLGVTRTVLVYFFDDNGQPLTLNVDGVAQPSFSFGLSGPNERSFVLTGVVPSRLDVGSIQVAGEGINNLSASLRFGVLDASGRLTDVVGILPVEPNFNWSLSAERRGADDTGVAVANPATAALNVTFDLYQGGSRLSGVSPVTRSIPPMGHLAAFVSQLFPGANYGGVATVKISSASNRFAAVALRADGSQFSSLPAEPGTQSWSVTYTGATGAVNWSWQFVDGYTFVGYETNPSNTNQVRLRGTNATDINYFVAEWSFTSSDGTKGVILYTGIPATEGGADVVNGTRMQIKSDGTVISTVAFRAFRTF